jgi:hypothetical protein
MFLINWVFKLLTYPNLLYIYSFNLIFFIFIIVESNVDLEVYFLNVSYFYFFNHFVFFIFVIFESSVDQELIEVIF